jgi:hypothetical protein
MMARLDVVIYLEVPDTVETIASGCLAGSVTLVSIAFMDSFVIKTIGEFAPFRSTLQSITIIVA